MRFQSPNPLSLSLFLSIIFSCVLGESENGPGSKGENPGDKSVAAVTTIGTVWISSSCYLFILII